MPSPLCTDLYELNMAASYLARDMTADATFSLFVRRLPATRGFLVASGIESCLEWLEDFHFVEEDLEYLQGLGFSAASLEALGGLQFTGEVWAVPEGRVVLANEPILEVTAPIAEAQLVETYLLNQITLQTNLATKAMRCRLAAGDSIELVEFGMRRAHGIEAALLAARGATIAGFSSTSDVEAARRFGLRAAGTMAHSYVEAFPSEIEAFRSFAEDLPHRATFLVDTYDTLIGVQNAITVIGERHLEQVAAIRLDSGDLATLARQARTMLDAAGMTSVRIMASGGIDEFDVKRLAQSGAPIDAMGIGTRLVTAADAPYLDSAYKLVDYAGRGVAKLSEGKASLPGAKQVFRRADFQDLLGLREEITPVGTEALLECAMSSGRRVLPFAIEDALELARERCSADCAALPSALRALSAPEQREPQLTKALSTATTAVHQALQASARDPNPQVEV